MSIDIVRGAIENIQASQDVITAVEELQDYNGTLYLGYPLSSTNESVITIDALLVTEQKGLVAISFGSADKNPYDSQDALYYQINNTLTKYEALRVKRELAIKPNIITVFSVGEMPKSENEYIFCHSSELTKTIELLPYFSPEYYLALCESLQKISTMKPRKKRLNVKDQNSRGGILKKIEKEIANLDEWQKKAAFETPEGPQRVRGLAGSGKTVVLALKAAYLHAQYPSWNIAVTFYTRSLFQQFKNMITNFSYEFLGDTPDWSKLHILHAWGTYSETGVYSELAKKVGVIPYNYDGAKYKFGRSNAFEGACSELLSQIPQGISPYYDALLIDEAQDMPISFFKVCYRIIKPPKRIVFAYDELQNLTNSIMPTLNDMFGIDEQGQPLVFLNNVNNEAKQDIVLPVCYRNTPWALTLAHALGFGIYRREGLVQLFADLDLWEDIGYKKVSGELDYNKRVKLVRKNSSSPRYFSECIEKEDAIITCCFDDINSQYKWVADEIEKNVRNEELDADDILVIFPEAYSAKRQYMDFRGTLSARGIDSILAGVNADRDTFKIEGCITCSSIYRAKGNEAPMVYIVNADYCAIGTEMITLRNILFTAITRSRAWVRICGIGPEMGVLKREIDKCTANDYALEFDIPTIPELEKKRLIHRDRTEAEKKKLKETLQVIKNLTRLVKNGEIDPSSMPELAALMRAIGSTEVDDDE